MLALYLVVLCLPLAMTVVLSFQTYSHSAGMGEGFTVSNYLRVVTDEYYIEIFVRTLRISVITTVVCLLIGVPEAYIVSRMRSPWKSIFLIVLLAPLLISVVVRTFGWSVVLGPSGPFNQLLRAFDIPTLRLLYREPAVVIALVHVLLPFMIIPVWASLQKLDPMVESAGLSLGASKSTVLRRIVFPQIIPGILSGSLIVFGLAASSFAIPGLLGGRRVKTVATVVYDEYLTQLNWPLGAAIAFVLLATNLAIMLAYNAMLEREQRRSIG
ncbi:ABC transporter permease [Chelatococcus asaccharovorans]|nr:ABC transporter permease [Chelatococcus asaccharovorans]